MNKNVPNILTMSRIACTPLVVLFFLLPIPYGIGKYIAFAIYGLACFTDLLDGKIARKYNLVSDFGKFMDQIADKFLTTTSMILVLFLGTVSGWIPMWASVIMLLIVVLRDILIGGIRMVCANKNIVISADFFGKIKSLFLDTANAILLFYIALAECVNNLFVTEIKFLGLSLLIVGVILSVVSCVNYIRGAIIGLKSQGNETADNVESEEMATEEFEEKIKQLEFVDLLNSDSQGNEEAEEVEEIAEEPTESSEETEDVLEEQIEEAEEVAEESSDGAEEPTEESIEEIEESEEESSEEVSEEQIEDAEEVSEESSDGAEELTEESIEETKESEEEPSEEVEEVAEEQIEDAEEVAEESSDGAEEPTEESTEELDELKNNQETFDEE